MSTTVRKSALVLGLVLVGAILLCAPSLAMAKRPAGAGKLESLKLIGPASLVETGAVTGTVKTSGDDAVQGALVGAYRLVDGEWIREYQAITGADGTYSMELVSAFDSDTFTYRMYCIPPSNDLGAQVFTGASSWSRAATVTPTPASTQTCDFSLPEGRAITGAVRDPLGHALDPNKGVFYVDAYRLESAPSAYELFGRPYSIDTGAASLNWTWLVPGQYQFAARSSFSYMTPVTVGGATPTNFDLTTASSASMGTVKLGGKVPTKIYATPASASISKGGRVTLKGRVFCMADNVGLSGGRKVLVKRSLDNKRWVTLTTLRTGTAGWYSYRTPASSSTFYYKFSYGGETHANPTSVTVKVRRK